jgi:hypothetical protein
MLTKLIKFVHYKNNGFCFFPVSHLQGIQKKI